MAMKQLRLIPRRTTRMSRRTVAAAAAGAGSWFWQVALSRWLWTIVRTVVGQFSSLMQDWRHGLDGLQKLNGNVKFLHQMTTERERIYIYYLLLSSSILSIRHSRDVDNPSALLFSNTIAIFLMLIGLTEIGFPIDIHLRMKLPPPHNKPRDSPGRKKSPNL